MPGSATLLGLAAAALVVLRLSAPLHSTGIVYVGLGASTAFAGRRQ